MLDWKRISELRGELGDTEFQLILEMFLDEIESVLMRLSDKDAHSLETALHFLKGCACNVGFSSFARLCDHEERKAVHNPSSINLERLMQCYSESKKTMMRGLDATLHPPPRAEEA